MGRRRDERRKGRARCSAGKGREGRDREGPREPIESRKDMDKDRKGRGKDLQEFREGDKGLEGNMLGKGLEMKE